MITAQDHEDTRLILGYSPQAYALATGTAPAGATCQQKLDAALALIVALILNQRTSIKAQADGIRLNNPES